jgi:uncharacterized protein involved in exopolysaccharide biosynthesis
VSWSPQRALDRPESSALALPNVSAVIHRQKHVIWVVGIGVFVLALVYGLLLSDRYEARMEILVEQAQLRRADPVLTGDANAGPIVNDQSSTSDEVLNSEIALLRSNDVLQKVVTRCGLDAQPGLIFGAVESLWKAAAWLHVSGALERISAVLPFLRRPTQEQLTQKAVSRLAGKLRVEIIKLSDVIAVSYRASDPQQAAHVLNVLGDVYLNEHAQAHHPAGEVEFFEKQTDQARADLAAAEQKLVAFTENGGVANGETQLQDALKRLSDTQAAEDQTRAQIAGTSFRINALEKQSTSIPPRQTTVLKSSDSALLIQQLKSSLLDLQLKRTQLLTQYQPGYPLVVEVEQQIKQAQAALQDAQKSEVEERTTDRDPNFEQVREDLTRSRVELAGLQAQAISLASEYAADDRQVRWLQQQDMSQQDLERQEKAAEDNYLLLLHKQQEAQVSEALDQRRIFNVSIVQNASVPALPIHPALWYVMYGLMLALLGAFAAGAGADRLDPTLRTPDEAEHVLQAPVVILLSPPALMPPLIENGRNRRGQQILKLT